MLLQTFPKNQSKFVRFAVSSLLLVESAIATSVIGAIASTQSGWFMTSPAAAHEAPQSSQTLSKQQSGAALLGGVIYVNCLQAEEMGVRPEHCRSHGGVGPGGLNPESLKAAEDQINDLRQAGFQLQQRQRLPKEIANFSF